MNFWREELFHVKNITAAKNIFPLPLQKRMNVFLNLETKIVKGSRSQRGKISEYPASDKRYFSR